MGRLKDFFARITSWMPSPTYVVKEGDTLSHIALKFYGDGNDYMKIYNANRDKLSDPDEIKPGQILRIP